MKNIDILLQDAKNSLSQIENKKLANLNINLNPKNFSKITEICHKKLLDENSHKIYFGENFNEENFYSTMSLQLDSMMNQLKDMIKDYGVSLESNEILNDNYKEIMEIIQILGGNFNAIQIKENNGFVIKKSNQKDKLKEQIQTSIDIKNRILDQISKESLIKASVVANNFEWIFMFYGCCVKTAKKFNDDLLLIEISSQIDKIIQMIRPTFLGNLDTKKLIYYYLIYEFKILKKNAIGEEI